MALRNFLENINSLEDWGGVSNAGLINIETGQLNIGTKWFKQCMCDIYSFGELQFICQDCDRSKKNSWQCPSGYGDGIYTIVSFINKKGEIIAAAVYLDDNSSLAQEFIQNIDAGEIREFNSMKIIFSQDFMGIEAGHLSPNAGTTLFSDGAAGIDSGFPTVCLENWVSGDISIFMFVEDSLENPTTQVAIQLGSSKNDFNGGLEGSIRPRVILLVSDGYRELSASLSDLIYGTKDWSQQIDAWSRQSVKGNVGNQSLLMMYWNGQLENNFMAFAAENDLENTMDYAYREFSWYLQGRTFGSQECSGLVDEMIAESKGELLESDLLRGAYLMRGLFTKANEVK
jgi:hypothetical protein